MTSLTTPCSRLRLGTAAVAWAALGTGALARPGWGWVALAAASGVLMLWSPWPLFRRWVPLGVAVVCVGLLTGGSSMVVAVVSGTLVAAHVIAADVLEDAPGARAAAVRGALRDVAPAVLAGGAAASAAVLTVVLAGSGAPGTPSGLASGQTAQLLRMVSPFLLLVAVLLALGLSTRRPGWSQVTARSGLSAVTRRYLDRVAERQ